MAKRPTVASLKKVTPENLAGLGAERLAEILAAVADTRPELKRRLRMELAAEHGAEHLGLEIDKRLGSLETSQGKVSWRQRPTFVRDLDALRALIAGRMAKLDRPGAVARMWRLMGVAKRLRLRVRDKDGTMAQVFARAAADLGGLVSADDAGAMAQAMAAAPMDWAVWLPGVLEKTPPEVAGAVLRALSAREGATASWLPLLRMLADRAGDAAAYRATFTEAALKTPSVAAEVAQRLLAAGEVLAAGELLAAAAPGKAKTSRWLPGKAAAAEPDFDWESAWIDWLEASGQRAAAQDARWASFERTLSAERGRAFTKRLADFDDVEAEQRAFEMAAGHADFAKGLGLLIAWPALAQAARMIEARADDIEVDDAQAQAWAAALRGRYPAAAHTLLRRAAAAAFRRRDFATCDRLTSEAEAIGVG